LNQFFEMNPLHTMKKFSLIAILISALFFLGHDLQVKLYNNPEAIINNDVIIYYQVLPAVFVEHDLKFSFLDKPVNYPNYYWVTQLKNGNRVNKFSLGMAYMYMPFFVPLHYSLVALGIPAHGFTFQYKIALLLASVFYTLLALIMLRKMLLQRFSDSVVAITLLVLALGTNLFYYATIEAPMSHAFSFFLITSVIYFSDLFFKKPGIWLALLIGLAVGLTALVRPTNVLVAIIPLLWGVSGTKQFQARLLFWLKNWKYVLLALAGFILIWTPQVLYWKYITGQFYYNGYGDDGIMFNFTNPQIVNTLFSYRKGWLVYTPVMSFALLGFIFLKKYYKESFLVLMIYFSVCLYVLTSWWLWWYGGGYGSRAFVDLYGVLAFPLASMVAYLYEKRNRIVKGAVVFVFVVFIAHNLFQVRQVFFGAIHYMNMTKEAYWESFGILKPTARFTAQLVPPDYKAAAKGLYPDPVVKIKSPDDWIAYYKGLILADSGYMNMIVQKAKDKGVSQEQALNDDARWCYEEDLARHKKQKRFFIF